MHTQYNFKYNKPKNISFKNIFGEEQYDSTGEKKYKLSNINNENGWKFEEIDILGDMGFSLVNEYDMQSDITIPDLSNIMYCDDNVVVVKIYKTKEGYVIDLGRRYIFKTFDDMLKFIDSQ